MTDSTPTSPEREDTARLVDVAVYPRAAGAAFTELAFQRRVVASHFPSGRAIYGDWSPAISMFVMRPSGHRSLFVLESVTPLAADAALSLHGAAEPLILRGTDAANALRALAMLYDPMTAFGFDSDADTAIRSRFVR